MVSLLGLFCVIFNADSVQNGLSLLKGKEGEVIASDIVNIIDNPHLENHLTLQQYQLLLQIFILKMVLHLEKNDRRY